MIRRRAAALWGVAALVLSLAVAAPAHAAATVTTYYVDPVNGNNANATRQAGEPNHAGNAGPSSVWYNWTAQSSSPVTFDTSLSSFDTLLGVYTGNNVNNLTLVATNNNASTNNSRSRVTFTPVSGTTYRIAVDGFGGDFGELQLNWNMDSRLSISELSDGTVKLGLTGVDWQRYLLLESTDLYTWFTNQPASTMTGGLLEYTNAPSGTNGTLERQFYRALHLP